MSLPQRPAVEIVWTPGIPDEVVAAAEPLIERYAVLLPGWLHRLRVAWNEGAEEGEQASVEAHEDYREAKIWLAAGFLAAPADERAEVILHELCHVVLAPLEQLAAGLSKRLDADGPAGDALRDEVRKRREAVVTDLANGLARVLAEAQASARRRRK